MFCTNYVTLYIERELVKNVKFESLVNDFVTQKKIKLHFRINILVFSFVLVIWIMLVITLKLFLYLNSSIVLNTAYGPCNPRDGSGCNRKLKN